MEMAEAPSKSQSVAAAAALNRLTRSDGPVPVRHSAFVSARGWARGAGCGSFIGEWRNWYIRLQCQILAERRIRPNSIRTQQRFGQLAGGM